MRGRGFRPPVRKRATREFFIGLMSGTSADGVEASLICVDDPRSGRASVHLLAHRSLPFQKRLRGWILRSAETPDSALRVPPGQSTAELTTLHYKLGERFAAAAIGVAETAGVRLSDVRAIGSHGQTVCHRPRVGARAKGSTLQIGEAAVIAERTGVTTVADFRPADIAAGGLGAPLTPYAHGLLFSRSDQPLLVVNLGGIANVTWIPQGWKPDGPGGATGLKGFDTGPANILLDAAMAKFSRGRVSFDRDGKLTSKGRAEERLLCRLMSHPFIRRRPPKATGREEFGSPFLKEAEKAFLGLRGLKAMRFGSQAFCDFMATLAAFTARSIGKQVKRFLQPAAGRPGAVAALGEVIVCGGGGKNPVLMKGLQAEFPSAEVLPSDARGIPAEAVEAVSFALLARAALLGIPANVPAITGARRPVILGKIVPGGVYSSISKRFFL
ncbi:MAG: anhydro-N-acetylmuramic acid kinase [Nitrospinota bacterium]